MKKDICKRITTIRHNLGMNKNEFALMLRGFASIYWNN